MIAEPPEKRLPTTVDILLVCTVSVTLAGGLLILISISKYFGDHARDYETLGDLLGVLIIALMLGSHFGLVFYLERFVAVEVRLPRRALFFLQFMAVGLVSIITDSSFLDSALYVSACAVGCYLIVSLAALKYPAHVNVLFVYLVLALATLGIIAKCVVLFTGPSREQRAAQLARERRKRMREEAKRYDQLQDRVEALLEEHMKRMGEGKGDPVEVDETTDRSVEGID